MVSGRAGSTRGSGGARSSGGSGRLGRSGATVVAVAVGAGAGGAGGRHRGEDESAGAARALTRDVGVSLLTLLRPRLAHGPVEEKRDENQCRLHVS